MKHIIYSLMLNYLFIAPSYAQQPIVDMGNNGSATTIRFNNMKANNYEVLRGSPYLSEKFEKSSFQLNAGQWVEGMESRFNTYNQQIEYKKDNETMSSPLQNVKAFKIGAALFKSGYEPIDKQTTGSFYQVLHEGGSVLLKYTVTLMKTVKNFDDTKQGDEFVTYHTYYLMSANKKMTKITLSKKEILKIFPENKISKIEDFIGEKSIKFKTWDEVIELLKYADSV